MAMSVIQACRSLALSTWLLSFCFVHLLCLDFTVAEKEEWYTAFVNITYADPAGGGAELRSEKSECGRYGDQSPKQDARGQVALSASPADRYACDPGTRFNAPAPGKSWVALIPRGNCTYKDKIRHAAAQNASAVVIYNMGSSNANETVTMPYAGELPCPLFVGAPRGPGPVLPSGARSGAKKFGRCRVWGSRRNGWTSSPLGSTGVLLWLERGSSVRCRAGAGVIDTFQRGAVLVVYAYQGNAVTAVLSVIT